MSSLKILIPVKRVIDHAIRPRVNRAQTAVETANVKMSMNPFCAIAMEEAVRLREILKENVSEIIAVSAGPAKSADILRTAMGMGADRSILIETDQELEPLAVAKLLKKLVQDEGCNLVILGKQAIDDDCSQTGQMLAGLLNWPQCTCAAKVEFKDDKFRVTREIDGGQEIIAANVPLIITTDLRLNEPRLVSLPNIMKAKKKPIKSIKAEDLGIDIYPRLKTIKVTEPPARKGGAKVKNVDELISRLKEVGAIQ
ncbi:Electron transfer flavoprotein subunit beta [Neolecta irregularis DAH-3]|uniref:Probable electron transfer flavoprotein subunit beta n=1 Tax=Neolecta irregularis (strain DAH-3) TaxID=1198029 RepID=A0A1U7LK72_NEOID|nr:Electron transfer flavoprotein subunit beta [Neolecta irregularis DAH-3]|eukprot:OLL23039.1 Electron transfer flavoprotein subunit beta [Neolecta irregularis DAH-3]